MTLVPALVLPRWKAPLKNNVSVAFAVGVVGVASFGRERVLALAVNGSTLCGAVLVVVSVPSSLVLVTNLTASMVIPAVPFG